jgi:MFS family permease
MQDIIAAFRQNKTLGALFYSNIFLSFHYALVVYVNSSFLDNYFSVTQISSLYIIGSILNALLLLNISKVLNKIGNYKTTIYFLFAELLATLGIILTDSHFLIGFYFILHQVAVSVLSFNLDVFLESVATNEDKPGGIRGIYLTLANVTFVIAPLVISLLLMGNKFFFVYLVSFAFLLPMVYLIKKYFNNSITPKIDHIRVKETITEYTKDKNLYNVFMSNFMLQLFYAFMVVYTPLYLEKQMGLPWSEIGLIFTIMLVPFVLFELPVGELGDSKYGEKEFMTVGLIIMGLSTMFISFITLTTFWIWATVLFITRIGASFVEITTDTYFFKQVDQKKSDVISFYRMTRPIAYVAAPIIATVVFQFVSFQYIFMVIGILMIIGTKYSLSLVDTK